MGFVPMLARPLAVELRLPLGASWRTSVRLTGLRIQLGLRPRIWLPMPWYLALTVPFLTPDELGALLFAVRAPPLSRAPWVSIDIGGVVFWSGGFVRPLVAPSIGTWTLPAAASAAGTVWRLRHTWLYTPCPCGGSSRVTF